MRDITTKYEELSIELITLNEADVITTSAFDGEDDEITDWSLS